MNTYPFVEDYIEVIAGFKDPVTAKAVNSQFFGPSWDPIISLARYDVKVLESMANAVHSNLPLTERQADLAVKIITKYQRQLAQKNIDVAPVETPTWRMPLRKMNYEKRVYVEDDKIMLEFPFKTELIEGLRDFRKDSQGKGEWNKGRKRWEFALTEYNIVYLKTWGELNQFTIDDTVNFYDQLISEVPAHAIELRFVDDKLDIVNADDSLREYIEQHHGGINNDNLARLIDLAPVLGYTVDAGIENAWREEHGNFVYSMTVNRELKADTRTYIADTVIDAVVKYTDATQRWPVVLFEPDTTNKLLTKMQQVCGKDAIYIHRGKAEVAELPEGVKYIHTTVPISNLKIPLMLSTAGMMFGGSKSLMMQNSEKIIYLVAEVFSNKNNDVKVKELEG